MSSFKSSATNNVSAGAKSTKRVHMEVHKKQLPIAPTLGGKSERPPKIGTDSSFLKKEARPVTVPAPRISIPAVDYHSVLANSACLAPFIGQYVENPRTFQTTTEQEYPPEANRAFNGLISMIKTAAELTLSNSLRGPVMENGKPLTMCIDPRKLYSLLQIAHEFVVGVPYSFSDAPAGAHPYMNAFANNFPMWEELANGIEAERGYFIWKTTVPKGRFYDQVFVGRAIGPELHKLAKDLSSEMAVLHSVRRNLISWAFDASQNLNAYTRQFELMQSGAVIFLPQALQEVQDKMKMYGDALLAINTQLTALKRLIIDNFVGFYTEVFNRSIWTSGDNRKETRTISTRNGPKTISQPTSKSAFDKILREVSKRITPKKELDEGYLRPVKLLNKNPEKVKAKKAASAAVASVAVALEAKEDDGTSQFDDLGDEGSEFDDDVSEGEEDDRSDASEGEEDDCDGSTSEV